MEGDSFFSPSPKIMGGGQGQNWGKARVFWGADAVNKMSLGDTLNILVLCCT